MEELVQPFAGRGPSPQAPCEVISPSRLYTRSSHFCRATMSRIGCGRAFKRYQTGASGRSDWRYMLASSDLPQFDTAQIRCLVASQTSGQSGFGGMRMRTTISFVVCLAAVSARMEIAALARASSLFEKNLATLCPSIADK